jgi:Xaa-Pro aminopeptidase
MDTAAFTRALRAGEAGKELAFPMAEYEARLTRVRQAMEVAGLDALLVTSPPDLFYLAGYHTFSSGNHACLVLPRAGAPTLQVTSLETPGAVVTGWVEDVAVADWHLQTDAAGQLAGIVSDMGLAEDSLGIQPATLGLLPHLRDQLAAALPRAKLVDTTELVGRVRLVKSAGELDCLRQAAAYTGAGILASYAVMRPGATDNDVARAGYDAMIAAGSEFLAVQPIVTSGIRTTYVHQTFRRVPLAAGDVVFLEYGGCHLRYTAPTMRTAVIGEAPEGLDRVAEAVNATVAAILEAARPGRTCHEVAVAAGRGHAELDAEIFFSGAYGYHVGVGFPPSWAERFGFIARESELELAAGMTFHLPVCFRVAGRFGVGLSETIHITESGAERITDLACEVHRAPA